MPFCIASLEGASGRYRVNGKNNIRQATKTGDLLCTFIIYPLSCPKLCSLPKEG